MNSSIALVRGFAAVALAASTASAAPVIFDLQPTSGPTTGGSILTITGTGFSPSGNSVWMGTGGCPILMENSGQILCRTLEGTGASKELTVMDDAGSSSNIVLFSYQGPSITGIAPSSGPELGGTVITLTGSNFGATGADAVRSVSIGASGAACPLVAGASSHGEVLCTTPAGTGTSVDVVVNVDGQSSNAVHFDYVPPPAITTITPSSASTKGGTRITINGNQFRSSGNAVSLGGSTCPVALESTVEIECDVPEGLGADVEVIVTADGQASPPYLWDYDAPSIDSITPDHGPTEGNVAITIAGSNFGAASADAQRSVLVGTTPCPLVASASHHDAIECMLPEGQGAGRTVSVSVAGQSSNSKTVDYDAPDIVSLQPTAMSALGGEPLTINGANFGLTASVSVDGNDCPITLQSHTQLRCTAPAATAGLSLPVLVSVSGLEDETSIEYRAPACGNDILDTQAGEICDDGNVTDRDGCSADCEEEHVESPDAAKCILSLNKAAANLVKAQGRMNENCAKSASAGTNCIGVSEDKALQTATTKLAFALSGQCQANRPFLPIGSSPAVEDANKDETVALARDLFGADPDAALVPDPMDPDRSTCQRDVLKATHKLMVARLKSFGRCKKAGLKDEIIRAPGQLGRCLATTDSDAKLDKPTQAQFAAVIDSCVNRGVNPALAFAGSCSVSPSVGTCLAERVKCRVCRALNATDGTDEDCDDYDDDLDNESCN